MLQNTKQFRGTSAAYAEQAKEEPPEDSLNLEINGTISTLL